MPDAFSRDPGLVAFRIAAEEIDVTLATNAEFLEPVETDDIWQMRSNGGELQRGTGQYEYLWQEEVLAMKMKGARLYTRGSSSSGGRETSNDDWEMADEQGMEARIMLQR